MNAAILCSGPSLLTAFASLWRYDLLIGVNRAPFIVRRRDVEVDAWCGDSRAIVSGSIDYDPLICCDLNGIESVGLQRDFTRTITHEFLLRFYPGPPLHWCDFSATSAIILAAHLGAKRIDSYGSDWTCEPDADGVSMPSNRRTPDRWDEERKVWMRVAEYLAKGGIEVHRR